jgi:hypothetical protein
MSGRHDRKQRHKALDTQLSALSDQRARAFRENSYAMARQRAGVTQHDAAKMAEFADAEVAGDSAMTDLRRQMALIDAEREHDQGGVITERRRRLLSWLRR